MKGAHCLTCLQAGPDLVVKADGVPEGMTATIRFTCGRCTQRWIWTVRNVAGRLTYECQGSEGDLFGG